MDLQELSSAVGSATKEEAVAKGEKLREAVKFGKWKVRTWGRWVEGKRYWHYELQMDEDVPLTMFIGGSQGRSESRDCFYVDIKTVGLDVRVGWDKEYLEPFPAVLEAYRQYAQKVGEHNNTLESIERNIFGVRTV